jgi:hypothetical protein
MPSGNSVLQDFDNQVTSLSGRIPTYAENGKCPTTDNAAWPPGRRLCKSGQLQECTASDRVRASEWSVRPVRLGQMAGTKDKAPQRLKAESRDNFQSSYSLSGVKIFKF